MLYKVSDFRQVGMPVRALVATREDAVAFARSIGCGEDDAYIEMVDANAPDVVDVLHGFLAGRAPTPWWGGGGPMAGSMAPDADPNAPAEAA